MNTKDQCAKCGHPELIPGVRVICKVEGSDQDVQLRFDCDPHAVFFKRAQRSVLTACICARCGFTEFFVNDPASLYSAYRESQA